MEGARVKGDITSQIACAIDELSAAFGMLGAAVETRKVDLVLPLQEIGYALVTLTRAPLDMSAA